MLQINGEAVEALKKLGPLRIRAIEEGEEVELEIEEATEPSEGDQVVERDGVRIFLDPGAVTALGDQVIGVQSHGDHVHFTFDDQPA